MDKDKIIEQLLKRIEYLEGQIAVLQGTGGTYPREKEPLPYSLPGPVWCNGD